MNRHVDHLTRREALARISASALGLALPVLDPFRQQRVRAETAKPKSVAAVMTLWVPGSHADAIVGKIWGGLRVPVLRSWLISSAGRLGPYPILG